MNNTVTDAAGSRDCPCKGCTERVADPNCHGTCERYMKWQANELERNERTRIERSKYAISETKRRWINQELRRKK